VWVRRVSKVLLVLLVRTLLFPALLGLRVRWVLRVLRVRLRRFPALPDLRVRPRLCQVPPDLLVPLAPRVLLRPFLALSGLPVPKAHKAARVTLDPLDLKGRRAFRVSRVFRASQVWVSALRARLILSRNFLPTLCRVTCG
jgi:hypothetical protein